MTFDRAQTCTAGSGVQHVRNITKPFIGRLYITKKAFSIINSPGVQISSIYFYSKFLLTKNYYHFIQFSAKELYLFNFTNLKRSLIAISDETNQAIVTLSDNHKKII